MITLVFIIIIVVLLIKNRNKNDTINSLKEKIEVLKAEVIITHKKNEHLENKVFSLQKAIATNCGFSKKSTKPTLSSEEKSFLSAR